MKTVLSTDKAPAAIGPYSQAIETGDLIFISGQIPVDPKTGNIVPGTVADQAKQSLENLKAIVENAGCTMEHVVKTTVFATDMANFAAVNDVYKQYFTANPPARSFVAVKALPKDALVEMEAIVCRKL